MDTTDTQIRLAALQQAHNPLGPQQTGQILDRAIAFYAFLTGGFVAGVAPAPIETVDPLPLAGEPLIETGAAKAANEAIKRTRRTKAEMEAARAADSPAIQSLNAIKDDLRAVGVAVDDPVAIAQAATAATPAPAAEPPTMADAKAAAMRVVERDGLGQEAALAIVKSFGVTRISALEEKQFVAFVDACNARLA